MNHHAPLRALLVLSTLGLWPGCQGPSPGGAPPMPSAASPPPDAGLAPGGADGSPLPTNPPVDPPLGLPGPDGPGPAPVPTALLGAPLPGPPSVTVHLRRILAAGPDAPGILSFGLPLPPGAVADAGAVRIGAQGRMVPAGVRVLLLAYGPTGDPAGVRAIQVQLPGGIMRGGQLDLDVYFQATTPAPPIAQVTPRPYSALCAASPAGADTAERTIVASGGGYRMEETRTSWRYLYSGREPLVLATYPPGYLAQTGILGPLRTAGEVAQDPSQAGLRFLSDNLAAFALSAMYAEGYRLNPAADSVVNPAENYEAWLYDRCATFLLAHAHTGDERFLRQGLRDCSFYADHIVLDGPSAGTFSGNPYPDPKYSHLRGLYAYYALTGDERARAAATAVAELWQNDVDFVQPYAAGHLRGPDKLWTERLLATSLEGLYYGHQFTGDKGYLATFTRMFDTAYLHVTTRSLAALDRITLDRFPPQSCFIHSALQHGEGGPDDPWCSGWMSELLIDPLLRYAEQTGDPRVDEIFIRLSRFLRDVGSSYFDANPRDDRFLAPAACYNPAAGVDVRRLIPLYGSGLRADGTRDNQGEFDDYEHCADASALTAAALRALRRQGLYERGGPLGPFRSEGAALLAMHHEFAACAQLDFAVWTRPYRDPAMWQGPALAPGAADPATFIAMNKIGYPVHPTAPQRKLSWWFNHSLLQFALLQDAQVSLPMLTPGFIQPRGCHK